MLTDSLVEAFRVRLEALGFDLAALRIGGTPNRPLVQVRIDWPPDSPGSGAGGTGGVTVAECATASRALEAWLDDGGPLGPRYVLEVSSPGLERPLRWPRHWARFVGRDVTAKVAGAGPGPGPRVARGRAGAAIFPRARGGARAAGPA